MNFIIVEFYYYRLPVALSALYVRKFFNEEKREAVIELIFDIWQNFMDLLQTVEWMDEKTRKEAIRKAKAITIFIGHPNELNDNDELDEYYSDLDLEPDNFFMNTLRVQLFEFTGLQWLRNPVNKTDWRTHSDQSTNAPPYNYFENSIST